MVKKLHRAVFLDRDGVINRNKTGYVKTKDELELISGVVESVKQLKNANFLVIVITNQSAVNRGLTTHENISEIHSTIQNFFKSNGALIDRFYYCPHRPDENCECRKPKPGLLLKAAQELGIDLKSSWMIGDRDSDMEAAQLVGCKSLKINAKTSLSDAVQSILNSIHS